MSTSMLPPPPPMPPPPSHPPLSLCLSLVDVDILGAALTKLGIEVPASKVLEAIKEEVAKKEASDAALFSEGPKVPPSPSGSFSTTPTSTFVEHPPKPVNVDPLSKERRCILIAMTDEAFPPGQRIPDPFYTTLSSR
ncbi:hypothetical protein BDZ97DRAFT_1917145 [Flammula alnicola]|nr:hypothetical protein BDZ97DRAFT_1917145 [Flammula alnicola]